MVDLNTFSAVRLILYSDYINLVNGILRGSVCNLAVIEIHVKGVINQRVIAQFRILISIKIFHKINWILFHLIHSPLELVNNSIDPIRSYIFPKLVTICLKNKPSSDKFGLFLGSNIFTLIEFFISVYIIAFR